MHVWIHGWISVCTHVYTFAYECVCMYVLTSCGRCRHSGVCCLCVYAVSVVGDGVVALVVIVSHHFSAVMLIVIVTVGTSVGVVGFRVKYRFTVESDNAGGALTFDSTPTPHCSLLTVLTAVGGGAGDFSVRVVAVVFCLC